MRMGKLFWPVLLIIAGSLMLIKTVFNIKLPVLRILLAAALVWGGASLIGLTAAGHTLTFGSRMETADDVLEYTVMFDSSALDLTRETMRHSYMKVNCAFGSAVVALPSNRSVHIDASGAFCSLRAPNGRNIAFGEGAYDCGAGEPLAIKANCTFGRLVFLAPDTPLSGETGGKVR